jgi:hypothetical protein
LADLAGGYKADELQPYGCEISARFIVELLRAYSSDQTEDVSAQTGSSLNEPEQLSPFCVLDPVRNSRGPIGTAMTSRGDEDRRGANQLVFLHLHPEEEDDATK